MKICGKCKKDIPTGQEVLGPSSHGFYHKECDLAALRALVKDVFKRPD